MASLRNVPVADFILGNGWVPGSTRRVVIREQDSTWNVARDDRSIGLSSAVGIAFFLALLGTLLQLSL
ncbi:hypothetical protein GGI25_002458 [Coemansia spiralis]|uniref:Uncharacterized protein n=1 Tax=Coemansia spiralis TaxID=417178 RepID=A0A9W8KZ06_9FUNG|nr:hypothetical protein GGI26_001159 [Coemansia sp. RSA 1358]KAJ2678286.1 hypothetical protein GGI25_002458 [Coemansia spiralis]